MGGQKAQPHWRPELSYLVNKDIPHYFSSNMTPHRTQIIRALTDSSFSGWQSWPTKTSTQINAGRVKDFGVFQSKVWQSKNKPGGG